MLTVQGQYQVRSVDSTMSGVLIVPGQEVLIVPGQEF